MPGSRAAATSIVALLFLAAACDGDSSPTTDTACTVSASWALSDAIPTVVGVTLASDAALDSAIVEYGPDSSYGLTAPIDLAASSEQGLVLGLKPSREYHFRVVAESGDASCATEDHALTTGDVANGLTLPTLVSETPNQVSPGFLVLSEMTAGPNDGGGPVVVGPPPGGGGEGGGPWQMMIDGGAMAPGAMMGEGGAGPMWMGGPDEGGESLIYILDHEGDPVWWITAPLGEVSRARLSHDGKFVLALSINVDGGPRGQLVKISMDGREIETIPLPGSHHDFTVTPDGGIAFIRKSEDGCDEIVKRSSDGELGVVFRVADAFGGEVVAGTANDRCHTNSIHYNQDDDSFTFSVLNLNAYVKVSAAGELRWVLGGEFSDFSGEGAEWLRQHGHHLLDGDTLLFFNNGEGPGRGDSLALEVELDSEDGSAERVFEYAGGEASAVLGDVLRLPNGNTLVAYSTAGVVHEVSPEGTLVAELRWPLGGAFGYVEHRSSLYGPPSR
jgi:hypothetical protein